MMNHKLHKAAVHPDDVDINTYGEHLVRTSACHKKIFVGVGILYTTEEVKLSYKNFVEDSTSGRYRSDVISDLR